MEDLKTLKCTMNFSWRGSLALVCLLCLMSLTASAQQALPAGMEKNEKGEFVPVQSTVYTFNGQVVELGPEKLAYLQGLLLERGLDPATVLTGTTVEIGPYMTPASEAKAVPVLYEETPAVQTP
jgi:hypothetical protein